MSQCKPKIHIDNSPLKIGVRLGGDLHFGSGFGVVHEVTSYDAEPYRGAYEVTPKVDKQILPTAQKLMVEDVVVKPIPKEYGLVTYDHTRTITVQ